SEAATSEAAGAGSALPSTVAAANAARMAKRSRTRSLVTCCVIPVVWLLLAVASSIRGSLLRLAPPPSARALLRRRGDAQRGAQLRPLAGDALLDLRAGDRDLGLGLRVVEVAPRALAGSRNDRHAVEHRHRL